MVRHTGSLVRVHTTKGKKNVVEEELLETLQRFKALDTEQLGTVTYEQYKQVTPGPWWSTIRVLLT